MSHANDADTVIDPNDTGDPDASSVAYIGLVGTLHVIAVILAVSALYYAVENHEYETKVLNVENRELKQLQSSQKMALLGPAAWTDKAKGVARININQAIALTAAELDKSKAAAPPPPAPGVWH